MGMGRALFIAPWFVTGVPTPHGDRPAECVVEIPDGATFFESEGGLVIEHGNGTLQSVLVHSKCHTDQVAMKYARRRSGDEPNEWKDNAGYTYRSGYKKFTGKYNIPSNPRSGGQTLFYFIGMENTGGGPVNILQPVLGWHSSGWDLASWACCPSNISTTSRTISGLQAGQTIYGAIERVDGSTWRIDSTVNGQTTTLTPRVGSYDYIWADVTLEEYSVNQCSQYSDGTMHFTEMELTAASGEVLTPVWTQPSGTECQGNLVIHDAKTIDISHNGGDGPTPTPTPTPTPSPTPGCVDQDSASDCSYWKNQGYCGSSSQYYSYMQQNCCHTCGFGVVV